MADRRAVVRISKAFHEEYEILAPTFGWETQEQSRTVYEDLPEENRKLMEAVVENLIDKTVISPG